MRLKYFYFTIGLIIKSLIIWNTVPFNTAPIKYNQNA